MGGRRGVVPEVAMFQQRQQQPDALLEPQMETKRNIKRVSAAAKEVGDV
jgi:hypothetical protein